MKLHEQNSIFVKSILTSPKTKLKIPSQTYVDSSHENSRSGRDLSSVFNDQDNEFDKNKLPFLNSVSVNRYHSSDNELANKKCVDGSIGEKKVLRFNQALENYSKVSVGNDTYIRTKYDKIQITDKTIIEYPNTDGYLL